MLPGRIKIVNYFSERKNKRKTKEEFPPNGLRRCGLILTQPAIKPATKKIIASNYLCCPMTNVVMMQSKYSSVSLKEKESKKIGSLKMPDVQTDSAKNMPTVVPPALHHSFL